MRWRRVLGSDCVGSSLLEVQPLRDQPRTSGRDDAVTQPIFVVEGI